MTALRRPAGSSYKLYELHFTSGGVVGSRQLWALDQDGAEHLLSTYPSCWGLPGDQVTILRVTRLFVREEGMLSPDERREDQRAA